MVNATGINSNMYFGAQNLKEAQFLEEKLEQIDDKQGFLGNIWNGVKEITTLGVSKSDCESMLEKYNNGEISFEEAVNYLDEFDSKQETMSSLLSNILTGAGAIATASAIMMSGGWAAVGAKGLSSLKLLSTGFSWTQAFRYGAPIGAVLKTGINMVDRATNDIEGDTLDSKKIAKDAISGALTGAASAVSSASSLGYSALKEKGIIEAGSLVGDIAKGALCGVECGAMSGATSYMTDVAFGDKEFNFGDLTSNTLTSAFVSGTVGGVVGSATHGMDVKNIAQVVSDKGKILKDSLLSSSRKVGGQLEREVLDI